MVDESFEFNNTKLMFLEKYKNDSQITILYPIVGVSTVLMSFGYLYLAIQNIKKNQSASGIQLDQNESEKDKQKLSHKQWILLIILIGLFFFYNGSELLFSTYLATFCVKSLLKLSKKIGSQITATFWGCFATMRFVSIFTAIFFKPIYIILISCLISLIGKFILQFKNSPLDGNTYVSAGAPYTYW